MSVAIIGGTGTFGRALARRLHQLGDDVLIGSRDAQRARERALEIGVQGDSNEEVVKHADLVVLATRSNAALETGAALGALKTAPRVATRVVRRNPVIAVAAVAGAGLLWYAARRRAKREGSEANEGTSKRIEAKRESRQRGNGQRARRGSRATSSEHQATT